MYTALLVVACGAAALAIRWRRPFALANVFVLYTFAIYVVAPTVIGNLSDGELVPWRLEFLAVLAIFVAAHWIGGSVRGSVTASRVKPSEMSARLMTAGSRQLLFAFLAMVGINLALVVRAILSTGIQSFFSGANLVSSIQGYGEANASGAAQQAITFAASALATALLCVGIDLATSRIAENRRAPSVQDPSAVWTPRLTLGLCFLWFVCFPVLQFSRSGLVFGTLTFLVVRSRLVRRQVTVATIAVGVLALGFFVYVGLSRAQGLGAEVGPQALFVSELSPWSAYWAIKENIGDLEYQHGRTIFLPLLLKVVPRGLYPDKPYNTSGYFMSILYPEAFRAGFSLAPTVVGDLYLNFGLYGVFIGVFIIGLITGWMDLIYSLDLICHGLFCMIYANYIILLRNNLSESLFFISVTVFLYILASRLFLGSRVLLHGGGSGGDGAVPAAPVVSGTPG